MKKTLHKLLIFFFLHWPVLITAVVLSLLLARNPFSQRNLISNFEPFPDSFHYVVPPRCLLAGNGWRLCRPNMEGVQPDVAPLYSLTILPFLLLDNDPRVFYFTNVSLAFTSLILMYLILKRNRLSPLVIFSILVMYVTSYYSYWLPTLAMAENVLITVFLLNVWLFLRPANLKTVVLSGVAVAALYGAKFSALPVMGVCYLFFAFRYLNEKDLPWKKTLVFTIVSALAFLILGGWKTVLAIILGVLPQIVESAASSSTSTATEVIPSESWFSAQYFSKNIMTYARALLGQPIRFLWHNDHVVPMWVSLLGFAGLTTILLQKKKTLALLLLATLFAPLITLSFFYTTDARYIILLLPILLMGAAFFLDWLLHAHRTPEWRLSWVIFVVMVLISYELPLLSHLRTQLALNFKYAETPWWYLATQELNTYFSEHTSPNRPYVATLITPYYADFFSNSTYQVLPLWPDQDFYSFSPQVWGIKHTKDWAEVYTDLLKAGNDVYFFSYGLHAYADADSYQNHLIQQFKAEPTFTGCAGSCTLYKLSL